MIKGDARSKYQPTIEAAVEAENKRIISRYAKKFDTTASWIKQRLEQDPDFLKKNKNRKRPLLSMLERDEIKDKKQSKREQITVSTRDMILDSLATEGLNTNELRSVNAYRNRISRINELVEERSRVEIELIEIINQKGSEAASRRSELRVKKNNLTQRITREESLLYEQEKTKYIRKVATDVMVKRIEAAVENGEMPEVARYSKEITTLFENRIASLRKSEEDKRVRENTSRSNVIAARGVFCFVLIVQIHYTLSCDL